MDNKQLIIKNALTRLACQVDAMPLSLQEKSLVTHRLHSIDPLFLERLCDQSLRRLTGTNLGYIICFVAGLDTQIIASIFAVTPATIYSVRCRLRAYFPKETILPF